MVYIDLDGVTSENNAAFFCDLEFPDLVGLHVFLDPLTGAKGIVLV